MRNPQGYYIRNGDVLSVCAPHMNAPRWGVVIDQTHEAFHVVYADYMHMASNFHPVRKDSHHWYKPEEDQVPDEVLRTIMKWEMLRD